MRRIEHLQITAVPNRNMIPDGGIGLFYVENEDVVVMKT